MINIGWAGNELNPVKRFDLAQQVGESEDINLIVAGRENGTRKHSDMPNFYKNEIDALLVTSSSEARPRVAYEALATGCHVFIPFDVGDLYPQQAPNVTYYAPWYDADGIVEMITEHFESTTINARARAEIDGVHWTRINWGWHRMVPMHYDMYRDAKRIAITVDVPGWTWDIVAAEFKKYLPMYDFDVIYATQPAHSIDWDNYDLIINHMWLYFNDGTALNFPNDRNIVCANGYGYLGFQEEFFRECRKAKAVTSSSAIIAESLNCKYLPRGIDLELFDYDS